MNKLFVARMLDHFSSIVSKTMPCFQLVKLPPGYRDGALYKWDPDNWGGTCFVQIYLPKNKNWVTIYVQWSRDGSFPSEIDNVQDAIRLKTIVNRSGGRIESLDDLPAVWLTPVYFGYFDSAWELPPPTLEQASKIYKKPEVGELLRSIDIRSWELEPTLFDWNIMITYLKKAGFDVSSEILDVDEAIGPVVSHTNEFITKHAFPYLMSFIERQRA